MKNSLQQIALATAIDNPLVLVFADSRYEQVLQNWLLHLDELGINNYLVVALDEALDARLDKAGKNVFLGRTITDTSLLWAYRISIINDLVSVGLNVIHSDADAVWLQNPISELMAQSTTDLVFTQGTIWPPDAHASWGFVLCCGLFSIKANSNTENFLSQWLDKLGRDPDDQRALNQLVVDNSAAWSESPGYQLEFRGQAFKCFTDAITTNVGVLRIAMLPHKKYQRIYEDCDDVKVRHLLSEKTSISVEQALRNADCWMVS